jgi:hypothetical protein
MKGINGEIAEPIRGMIEIILFDGSMRRSFEIGFKSKEIISWFNC